MPGVLAFDVAKATGVAYASEDAAAALVRGPLFDGGVAPAVELRTWLIGEADDVSHRLFWRVARAIDDLSPKYVAIEDVHVGVNPKSAIGLIRWNEAAFLGARHAGLPLWRILRPQPSTWRSGFLGHARGKSKALKDEALALCRSRGFSPKNDNEADALGVLHWACAQARRGG